MEENSVYGKETHGFCPQCGPARKVFITPTTKSFVESGQTLVELECRFHGPFRVPENALEVYPARPTQSTGPMDCDGLKVEAAKRGFTKIKRENDDASVVPLTTWNGFSGRTDNPHFFVQVDYYLEGNKVRIKRALDEQDHWYTLS